MVLGVHVVSLVMARCAGGSAFPSLGPHIPIPPGVAHHPAFLLYELEPPNHRFSPPCTDYGHVHTCKHGMLKTLHWGHPGFRDLFCFPCGQYLYMQDSESGGSRKIRLTFILRYDVHTHGLLVATVLL